MSCCPLYCMKMMPCFITKCHKFWNTITYSWDVYDKKCENQSFICWTSTLSHSFCKGQATHHVPQWESWCSSLCSVCYNKDIQPARKERESAQYKLRLTVASQEADGELVSCAIVSEEPLFLCSSRTPPSDNQWKRKKRGKDKWVREK